MPPTPTTWRLSSRGRALPPPASVFCNNADNYIVRCGVPWRGRAQQSGYVCAHCVHCDLFRSPPTLTSHTHDTLTTLISIKVSPLFSSAVLLLTVTSDLELEAVWQQRPGGVPGEAVVEGARVEAGHRDVEDPGETPGHRVLLLHRTVLHCTVLYCMYCTAPGDGVLPPGVLAAHEVHALPRPRHLVHRPQAQLPRGAAHCNNVLVETPWSLMAY